MRILSLTNCTLDERLGSGKTAIRWTRGLRDLGHTVDLFSPTDFTLYPSLNRAGRLRQALGARAFMLERIQSKTYDLVECYGGEFGWAMRTLFESSKRPFIVAHSDGIELLAKEREQSYRKSPGFLKGCTTEPLYRNLDWSAFEYADALIANCKADTDYALEKGLFKPEYVCPIAPGIDDEYLGTPFAAEREHRIAFIGSWIGRKDPETLVSVTAALLKEDKRLAIDLFGTGKNQAEIRELYPVDERPRVFVYSSLPTHNMQQQLQKAKVFFFPTLYEGFGMATAEAMACGCAVVTTPTGFGADLKDSEDALICNYADLSGMQKAIQRLLADDPFRQTLAQKGYQKVQGMSWPNQVKQLETQYLNWLENKR